VRVVEAARAADALDEAQDALGMKRMMPMKRRP